jgi:hypothetical protein
MDWRRRVRRQIRRLWAYASSAAPRDASPRAVRDASMVGRSCGLARGPRSGSPRAPASGGRVVRRRPTDAVGRPLRVAAQITEGHPIEHSRAEFAGLRPHRGSIRRNRGEVGGPVPLAGCLGSRLGRIRNTGAGGASTQPLPLAGRGGDLACPCPPLAAVCALGGLLGPVVRARVRVSVLICI